MKPICKHKYVMAIKDLECEVGWRTCIKCRRIEVGWLRTNDWTKDYRGESYDRIIHYARLIEGKNRGNYSV